MSFKGAALALLSLFSLVTQSTAIAIVDADICPIPYIVPRSFQSFCDPVDEHVTEEDLPTVLGTTLKGGHPQWLSSMLIRTRPNVWTIEPYCLRSLSARGDICAFTSTWFAGGRGISFVAAAGEGPKMAMARALKNQTLHEFDHWVNPTTDERMEVMPIPNKGLGVRSKRVMERGDAATSYTPVLSVEDGVMQIQPQNTWEQNMPLTMAVRNLPPKSQKLVMDLHGEFGGNPIYDKVNTNAFNALIGQSSSFYWSVYPETSRFNHDCRPNTMYSIDNEDLLHNLRVGRRIIPGEEITLSYLAPNMKSEERSDRMKAQWGFSCSCPLCSGPKDVREMSDFRVQLIEELESELNDLSENRTATAASADLLITLHEQERLDGVIGDAYMYAAFEHAYLGDKRGTQRMAALACEHMAIWRGTGHQYYQAMSRLMVAPENERSWQYFEKLKRGIQI